MSLDGSVFLLLLSMGLEGARGKDGPVAVQESLSVAHKTGAMEIEDLERVVEDATVQTKAVAHPTDAD